jgi:rhodanese-related sulfurtransferase
MPTPNKPITLADIRTIGVRELDQLRRIRSIEVIDVRTPEEYFAVRAAGARNVPLDALDPHSIAAARTSDEPIYFICEVGGRSAYACAIMIAAGYCDVINVEGGTKAWAAAGLPIEQGL